jgi:hypothetical protein
MKLNSEESKEEELVHFQIYYDYLKNFKDQESLIISIKFFSQFIQADSQINASV